MAFRNIETPSSPLLPHVLQILEHRVQVWNPHLGKHSDTLKKSEDIYSDYDQSCMFCAVSRDYMLDLSWEEH